MRDPKRIPRIIELLHNKWESNPDVRLGQLIYNIIMLNRGDITDIYYLEDDKLEKLIRKLQYRSY